MIDPTTQLSENFTLGELVASSTAARLGIDNSPTPEQVEKLRWLAANLEAVRALLGFPLHVDSGFRCLNLNRALRSLDASQHVKCEAIDFVCPQFGVPLGIVKAIIASTIQFDQCIQEGTWVHISFSEAPRREVLTAIFKDGSVTYVQGIA